MLGALQAAGTLALSEAGQRAAALALAAAAALAMWGLLLLVLATVSRPRAADPGPETSEPGGPEPPAVVCLLANRWELGHESVPATLLDLAARRVVSIEQVAPDRFVCRLRAGNPPDLEPYEGQVLDHVRSIAVNGVVPCEALTTGPEEQSKGWWTRFEKDVVADARRRGLSRSRWSRTALLALGIVAAVPALLAAAALVALPDSETSSDGDDENPVVAMVGFAAVAWLGLQAIPLRLRAERDTPEGSAAASRWLGFRQYLDHNEAFDRAPPAAVAIWDRYLAYGAAMGVAAGAVRALPLGSESDREAWSAYGGHWHVVRIRYPNRFPPGWGRHPLLAAAQGAATLAAAGLVARAIGPALVDTFPDLSEAIARHGWNGWVIFGTVAVSGALAVLGWFLVRSAVMLALAVPDLLRRVEVEGVVVRLRQNYVAVDDGNSAHVRAWRVEPAKLGGAVRGSQVRATISPGLGYVHRLQLLGQPAPRAPDHCG